MVEDSHHFDVEQDPDPHPHRRDNRPDSDPHKSEKRDPDPYNKEMRIRKPAVWYSFNYKVKCEIRIYGG